MKAKHPCLPKATKHIMRVLWLFLFVLPLKAQLKLGTDASLAHASAILELEARDKGLLFPRVSTANRINALSSAPAGLVVYDSDLNRLMLNAGVPANRIWHSMLLAMDTISMSNRLSAMANLNFPNATSDFNYAKRGTSNAASGIAKFYSWNYSDVANEGTTYSQSLELGHKAGTQNIQEMNAEVKFSINAGQGNLQGLEFLPQWYHKVEFKLKNQNPFLSFDSNGNLILGKANVPGKSMLINASSGSRQGVASIGHTNPDGSALLDLNFQGSNDDLGKGLLLPRYSTTTLKDNNFYNPATGLLVYDQTLNRVVMNAGTPEARDWRPMVLGGTGASQVFAGTAEIPSSGGTSVTASNSNVTAESIILLTCQSGDCGVLKLTQKTPGSGFEISAPSSGLGRKVIGYLIIN